MSGSVGDVLIAITHLSAVTAWSVPGGEVRVGEGVGEVNSVICTLYSSA